MAIYFAKKEQHSYNPRAITGEEYMKKVPYCKRI